MIKLKIRREAFIIVSLLVIQTGCSSLPSRKATKAETPITTTTSKISLEPTALRTRKDLKIAEENFRQGKWMAALAYYSSCQNRVPPETSTAELILCRRAECLGAMGNTDDALKLLIPVALPPENDFKRMRLALAGEILMKKIDFASAKNLFLEALSDKKDYCGKESWVGASYANLGTIYLRENKFELAKIAYRLAQEKFRLSNNSAESRQCEKIINTLSHKRQK